MQVRLVLRHDKLKGFTLVELMLVIAVIGVLAAMAIPQFQDYTARTRAAEGLVLAVTAKDYVTDDLVNGNSSIGSAYSFTPTKNTLSISVANDNSGVITVQSNTTPVVEMLLTPGQWASSGFVAHVAGSAIPSGSIVAWQCTSPNVSNKNLVPGECR